MRIVFKQHFITAFIMLTVFGCGQTTADKGSQTNIDSSGDNSVNNGNGTAPAFQQDCKKLDGSIFQYKDEGDPDDLTFTIVFHCKNDSVKGQMFGPDPEGEHGTYYFKSDLESLRLVNDSISFQLMYGHLYQKPFTLKNYNKDFPNKILGGDNGIMYYTGKLSGDSIVLNCAGQSADLCYTDVMVFKKK